MGARYVASDRGTDSAVARVCKGWKCEGEVVLFEEVRKVGVVFSYCALGVYGCGEENFGVADRKLKVECILFCALSYFRAVLDDKVDSETRFLNYICIIR